MPEKYSSLHDMLNAWFGGAFTALFTALLARLMWHGREARKGHRRFFGIELLWELPIAFGMVLAGEGLASYLSINQPASTGLIAALAYLGPRGVEVLFTRWFSKMEGGKT